MRVVAASLLLALQLYHAGASPLLALRQDNATAVLPSTASMAPEPTGSTVSSAAATASGTVSSSSASATPVPSASATPVVPETTAAFNWTARVETYNATAWEAQPYVANGYIGARLPAAGMGYSENLPAADDPEQGGLGWPLFGPRTTANMLAGFYCYVPVDQPTIGTNYERTDHETVISRLPIWTGLYVTLNDSTYSAQTPAEDISDYVQTFSFRNGTVQTNVTWSGVQLSYTLLAHRRRPSLGLVRLDISGLPQDAEVTISDVLDGRGAARVENQQAGAVNASELPAAIYSSLSPVRVPEVTAYEFSTLVQEGSDGNATLTTAELPVSVSAIIGAESSSTSSASYTLRAVNGSVSVWKAVGIASHDAFEDPRAQALSAASQAREAGWDALVEEHGAEWETIWNEGGDIEIHQQTQEGEDLQRVARASLFHLLANVREGSEGRGLGDNGIAPAGLTSDAYAGSIFWDDQTYMIPSLMTLFPAFSESSLLFRQRNFTQLERNAQQYNREGILYPWITGRNPACTGIGPCYDYEYHYNNGVVLAYWQYYQSTGNRTFLEELAWPIIGNVSEFFASQVSFVNGSYTLLNVTAPDEFANQVNSEAFTNAGTARTFEIALEASSILNYSVPSNWSEIAQNMAVIKTETPSNDTLVVEFAEFNQTVVIKQADVALLTYPLEVSRDVQPDPLADLEYYAGKTSAAGPAMTYSIYGIVASAVSESGCEAYTRTEQGWQPYVRTWTQFSEQQQDVYTEASQFNPAYTFLTGHGGFLQSFTHGLTGYRTRTNTFYLDPSLFPQLSDGITVRGMHWHGTRLDVSVGGSNSSVTHVNGTEPITVQLAERNPLAGNYTLAPGETLTFPTRRTDATLTSPGNLAQCKNATSEQEFVKGQFPYGAIDGSNATLWSPLNASTPSTLLIDLGEPFNISSLHVNWGQYPAETLSIRTGLTAGGELTEAAASMPVNVSSAFDAANALVIDLAEGNQTDVTLASTTAARFVALEIQGCATEGQLPTIAEAIVR